MSGTRRSARAAEDIAIYYIVIPAKAGIHLASAATAGQWIPAFDGMTICAGSRLTA